MKCQSYFLGKMKKYIYYQSIVCRIKLERGKEGESGDCVDKSSQGINLKQQKCNTFMQIRTFSAFYTCLKDNFCLVFYSVEKLGGSIKFEGR